MKPMKCGLPCIKAKDKLRMCMNFHISYPPPPPHHANKQTKAVIERKSRAYLNVPLSSDSSFQMPLQRHNNGDNYYNGALEINLRCPCPKWRPETCVGLNAE